MAYFTFLKKYFKNRAFVFNLRYMERTISKAKVNYLKKTNESYLEFNHNQLLEELYRVLKSHQELAWLLKRIKRETAARKENAKPKKMGCGSLSYGKMKMAGGGMVDDMKAAGFKMAEGGKMPMDPKTGKPTFVGDGKGKMGHGGMAYGKKKMMGGGMAYGKNKMMGGGSMARGSGAARPQKFGKNG